VLTLYTVPKPFRGHIGDIQRNAVASWRALHPDVQVVLVGDEDGVAEAAREAGVEHVGALTRNERGTPRLDSAFERVETVARHPIRCFVNADIVLLDDFLPAVERVRGQFGSFLMVGESRDLRVEAGASLGDPRYRNELRKRALADGRLRGYAALDYFVFPKGHFGDLPPFLIGRACFDNWLVWRARQRGPVLDATRMVTSVHQSHDYSHVAGGLEEAYYGAEAKHNERLAGGRAYIYSLHDATHRLTRNGNAYRYWGSTFRAREQARKARVRLEMKIEARRTRQRRLAPVRVVGVFPEQTPYRNPLLDTVSRLEDIDLSVLYAAQSVVGRTWSLEPPQHTHWVMRSFVVPAARRVLRHDYPINYTIWRALFRLRPKCVIVSGWSTFASQAAIVWCRLRGIPYLVVVESHDRDDRPGWRRAVKGAVVPAVVKGAAGVLVAGTLARESMIERGVDPARIRIFANTIDVAAFAERAECLSRDRLHLRESFGFAEDDVAVLSVARLVPEKGLATLVRAVAETADPRLVLTVVGSGPEQGRLERLAEERGVRLSLVGDLDWSDIVKAYVAADIFALLSESEPWGVVVNEAAACGLPLVLSDAVGAAHDLLVDGVNGYTVTAGDSRAAAAALKELATAPARRRAFGAASSERVADWGYGPSVQGLVELVQRVTGKTISDRTRR
jgi:glycosyltransferase involved in cell wall biosynthesis